MQPDILTQAQQQLARLEAVASNPAICDSLRRDCQRQAEVVRQRIADARVPCRCEFSVTSKQGNLDICTTCEGVVTYPSEV